LPFSPEGEKLEHLGRRQAKIRNQKFMMNVAPLAAGPFALERFRRFFGEIGKVYQTDRPVGLAKLELAAPIGGAVAEHRPAHQPPEGVDGWSFGHLAEEGY
jgi:hypothetical protein